MNNNREKLVAELKDRRSRIDAAITILDAGIEWQSPAERADFELSAKRQWLCERIGISPSSSWDEIAGSINRIKRIGNIVDIDVLNGILDDAGVP